MKALLFLPTQGPHLPRPGPPEHYDWRVQCRLAAALQRGMEDAVIYVPSAFQMAGSRSELEFYGEQLQAEGATALRLEACGLDTVEQCERAEVLAREEQAQLVVVTCHVQLSRVRYLLPGPGVTHCIAFGTPSPQLRFSNRILALAFTVLDKLGLRGWWKSFVARRRLQGRQ